MITKQRANEIIQQRADALRERNEVYGQLLQEKKKSKELSDALEYIYHRINNKRGDIDEWLDMTRNALLAANRISYEKKHAIDCDMDEDCGCI